MAIFYEFSVKLSPWLVKLCFWSGGGHTISASLIHFSVLANAFQEWDDRLEEDSLLIERILLLIRNILHVPANKQAEKVLSCFHQIKIELYEDHRSEGVST